ncbi:MAG: hypothetical protein H7Z10_08130 [Gemmatimonadaceae bacterium]|nr:hypothetical protein [Acetobacteraceae bacterium]
MPLAAGACTAPEPVRDLPPLRYNYLTPLRLNVASVDVGPAPPPSAAEAQSPTPAGAALRQMAQDRLAAGGTSGRAVFVIDQAQIVRFSNRLDGLLSVHLDVLTTDGARAGFAEARVSRSLITRDTGRAALYDLTRQMLDDMNVEFEFQVRRSLRDWLQDATTAPAPAPVEQQELRAPVAL